MNREEPIMDGPKRMQNELKFMLSLGLKELDQLQLLEPQKDNIYKWTALLMPNTSPYDMGAFKLEIDFAKDYPFKPPTLHINTKIYHPNVNERGQVCLPILEAEHWKPTTRIDHVLQVLVATINDPQPENPYSLDITKQFVSDPAKFYKTAAAWVERYSEHRPTPQELARIARRKKRAAMN
ncbi:ubiquitin-conjugating enzyme E2-18 kDa [Drosophila grimshawi]|uniref:Ubiquitin-conjugating enzyme E2-18 kDa n=1 Tax=Drosophila grimshawi TaxID=7222 RepID=B4IZ54_DROGR|nr:ubiquitin-conjugating enzyme E2-18 kDa [Drosophila grimshawi]XP_043071381.1 ubiquitin-conjugating enzyme E2-18 kDa [Drosophila grimshawi]EDV95576.1 GH15783 [Drosophila grimshawi]